MHVLRFILATLAELNVYCDRSLIDCCVTGTAMHTINASCNHRQTQRSIRYSRARKRGHSMPAPMNDCLRPGDVQYILAENTIDRNELVYIDGGPFGGH